MRTTFLVQKPTSPAARTLVGSLAAWPDINTCEELRVAVAYATVSGVRELLSVLPEPLRRSYWLIGLDDAITQPGALDLITETEGAVLRVASYQRNALRFHSKVFKFVVRRSEIVIVGSANLTSSALTGNGEAVAFLQSGTANDTNAINQLWTDLWCQGRALTSNELENYRTVYDSARAARRDLERIIRRSTRGSVRIRREVLASDDADLDPALARTCWIECGFITAMGRELEFKAEQGLFFGLPPAGGAAKQFDFLTSDGNTVRLRMKYQQNHMWRLQMNNDVPEVKLGLRPRLPDGRLGRSPYVAVFARTPMRGRFQLKFVSIRSRPFRDMLARSVRHGTVGQTAARRYGWY